MSFHLSNRKATPLPLIILDHHSRMKWIFLYFFVQFLGLDGPYLALLGPLLASPASGLTPSTRGNPVSTRSRPIFDHFFFATSEKSYLGVLLPKIDSYGLGTIIERSASKFCISGLRRRVKRSSWSNFMAMAIRFILQWRSRLLYMFKLRTIIEREHTLSDHFFFAGQ